MASLQLAHDGLSDNFDKIASIKAVRQLTGLGLKESKAAVETAMLGELVDLGAVAPVDSETSSYESHRILSVQGLELSNGATKTEFIIEAIKEAAKLAADDGEDELAILLLGVILQNKENMVVQQRALKITHEENRIRNHAERIRQEELTEVREQRWDNDRTRREQQTQKSTDHRL